jgi:hypothetical protein
MTAALIVRNFAEAAGADAACLRDVLPAIG